MPLPGVDDLPLVHRRADDVEGFAEPSRQLVLPLDRDTPHGLKPDGFSEWLPSYGDCSPACVWACTHDPQVVRDTILDHGGSRDLAGLPVLVLRQDVHLSHHVAMRLKPTGRALVLAPPRFVAMPAARTGLGRVLLVLQLDLDPIGFRLVRD